MVFKPHPKVLFIWRITLCLICAVPAFLLSLFFDLFGLVWMIGTAVWVIAFLFFFVYHFPRYFKSFIITVDEREISMHAGVIYRSTHIIPRSKVQFTSQYSNPVNQIFKIMSVRIVAAGGTILIPGLSYKDAATLTALFAIGSDSCA